MMGSTDEVQAGRSAHSCATCGRVATCVGKREGAAEEQTACNGCCGHGGEDGSCRPVEGPGFYVVCLKEPRDRMGLLWWKPARAGYTVSLEAAGIYTADEAYEICRSPTDCAAIPVAHARAVSWAIVTDSLLQVVLSARADRQDGAVPTRADGPRTASFERATSAASVIPHVGMWRLEMRSGEVVPVVIAPDGHRSIASARDQRAGGQSPYMATTQLALFVSATSDPVAGILAPGMADLVTIVASFQWSERCEVDLLSARSRYETAKVGFDQIARLDAHSAWRAAEELVASARRLVPSLLLTRAAAPPGGIDAVPPASSVGAASGRREVPRAHGDCPTCICGRRAVVQRDAEHGPGTVAWSEHLMAWGGYAAKHGQGQSAERVHERGGFSYGELRTYLGRDPTTWQPLGR